MKGVLVLLLVILHASYIWYIMRVLEFGSEVKTGKE